MSNKEFVTRIPEPAISRFLFADTRAAWFWVIVRLYVGWVWLEAGWNKVTDPLWTGDRAGTVVKIFINSALNKTGGAYPDVSEWYAWFLREFILPNTTIVAHLVAYGELLVGIGLFLGVLTGITAFCGLAMNMSYLFAGTVSINPIMALLQLFLILAWRVSGWVGLDRFLLPLLGTPWCPGKLFKKEPEKK